MSSFDLDPYTTECSWDGWEQSELEELSFVYAHPEEYAEVKRRVQVLRKEQEEVVLEVMFLLDQATFLF